MKAFIKTMMLVIAGNIGGMLARFFPPQEFLMGCCIVLVLTNLVLIWLVEKLKDSMK